MTEKSQIRQTTCPTFGVRGEVEFLIAVSYGGNMTLTPRLRPSARPKLLLHIAGDVGNGSTIILVHGIASNSNTFTHLVPMLSQTHRVISIDLLGFGGSPDGADYSVEEHVAALERTIRTLRLTRPFTIIGHSLGGLLIARYARRNPKRVRRLIMVNPPIILDADDIGDRRERMAVQAFVRSYRFLRENKNFTLRNFKVIARLLPIRGALVVTEEDWEPFVNTMKNCIESQTTVSDVGAVNCPVDVIYSSTDSLVVASGLRLVRRFRHVETHRVMGGDHLIGRRLARAVTRVAG